MLVSGIDGKCVRAIAAHGTAGNLGRKKGSARGPEIVTRILWTGTFVSCYEYGSDGRGGIGSNAGGQRSAEINPRERELEVRLELDDKKKSSKEIYRL